jgi:hypothetical protein
LSNPETSGTHTGPLISSPNLALLNGGKLLVATGGVLVLSGAAMWGIGKTRANPDRGSNLPAIVVGPAPALRWRF